MMVLHNISINFKAQNISAFPEAGWGDCLPYVQRLRHFPACQTNQ